MNDILPTRLFSLRPLSAMLDDAEEWIQTTTAQGLSVYENETHVFVDAAVPGIHPNDIEVTYEKGYVWIRGQAKEETEDKEKKYYRKAAQSFSYRVAIPGDLDPNKEPEATYKHGIMTVAFAKAPKSQPKKITVKEAK